jgi:hypothetical protein
LIWELTFFEQDPLEERVLVSKHQTFIGGAAVALLEVLERLLLVLNGALELFDILGPTFTEGRLGLAVALLALLGRGIDLTTLG